MGIAAGTLDRRIDIERATLTQDDAGAPVAAWAKLAANEPASYRPLKGEERFTGNQKVGTEQVKFRVRWNPAFVPLLTTDRVIYPATVGAPTTGSIFDIIAANEIGRQEGYEIIAFRRSDSP